MNNQTRIVGWGITAIGLAMAVFHLYTAWFGAPDALSFRAIHVGFALVLAFLIYPGSKRGVASQPDWSRWLLALLGIIVTGYILFAKGYIDNRMIYVDDLRREDWVLGTVMVVVLLEASRRTLGLALPITAIAFLVYAVFFAGADMALLMEQLYLGTEGIFGIPVSVSATYVVLFIIFGALVERPGQGRLHHQRPVRYRIGQRGGQRDDHRHLFDPADEKARLPPGLRRRGRGRGVDRRANHAADHGRGRLRHGRVPRHQLSDGRRICADPGRNVLPRRLPRRAFRGQADRHEGVAEARPAAHGRGADARRTSVSAARRHRRFPVRRLQRRLCRTRRHRLGARRRRPAQILAWLPQPEKPDRGAVRWRAQRHGGGARLRLLVPALVKLGVVLEAAHMFAFYFAILSAITPPVALAVYAAKGISGGGLWDTGLAALKLGATGYIVPFMFVFGPSLLLIGDPLTVLLTAITALIGVTCLASGLGGYLVAPLALWQRGALIAAALTLIKPGLTTDAIGLALAAAMLAINLLARRRELAAIAVAAD